MKAAAAVALLAILAPVPLALGATSLGLVPNPSCSAQPCAPEISGWVHTEPGSTILYNANGTAVPMVGVDVDGLDFGTGNPSTSPDACGRGYSIPSGSFSDVASWGFNSIRVPISWSNLEPTAPALLSNGTWMHHWNQAYLAELDSVVGAFGQAHVPLVLDFAQVDVSPAFQQAPEKVQGGECEGWGNPTWLYPGTTSPSNTSELASAMCSFFNDRSLVGSSAPPPIEAMEAAETSLAARYASNPEVIGVDMFNEPWFNSTCGTTKAEGDLLTSFYTKMGQAIEAVNPHALVIFEEPPPGLMSQSPIMTRPPSVPDAMYSFHIYTGTWSAGRPYMQAYLANAKAWGVPAWMGEFNDFEAGCTGPNCQSMVDPNWQADSDSLLSYCAANGINWAFFSYYSLGTTVGTPVPKADIIAQLRSALPTTPAVSSTTSTTTATTKAFSSTATATTSATEASSTSITTVSSSSTTYTASTSATSPPTTTATTSSVGTTSTSATTPASTSALQTTSSTTTTGTSTTTPEFSNWALVLALLTSVLSVAVLARPRERRAIRPRGE
ncbi:MAG TPA: cellulase family glycosylhydrolase [Nitrososphaerales archaeon]|nr:cellulase family glycosylhydrolase [Nitrososphaerales archaeon]